MSSSNIKKGKNISEIIYRFFLLTVILILVSLYFTTSAIARYGSISIGSEKAKVAKFGDLTFLEYQSDGTTLITGTEAKFETIMIEAGNDINKNLSLSFSNSQVAVYVFFVIETSGWNLKTDNSINELSIRNAHEEKMVSWVINSNWIYLNKEITEDNKDRYIFYREVLPNESFTDSLMDSLIVNAIGLDDATLLKSPGYSLKFKTYAMSKTEITADEAWNYVKNSN